MLHALHHSVHGVRHAAQQLLAPMFAEVCARLDVLCGGMHGYIAASLQRLPVIMFEQSLRRSVRCHYCLWC